MPSEVVDITERNVFKNYQYCRFLSVMPCKCITHVYGVYFRL